MTPESPLLSSADWPALLDVLDRGLVRIAGDRITTIQYEDFIRRFELAGPALLAACGLEWEESCRTYWKSNRVISTMSTMQARQPPGERAGRA